MEISTLLWVMGSVVGISLLSLVGVVFLSWSKTSLQKMLLVLVSFASGSLLGGAFIHMLPESTEVPNVFIWVTFGILTFFVLERFLRWTHCHKGVCDIHTFTYMNLIGDGFHNLLDGMIIAAAFLIEIPLGIAVTLAVAAHEIPQEIGDFGVLLYGGFSKKRALLYNLASALTAVLGAIIVLSTGVTSERVAFLLPFAAGGFIYIACVDLMPELHKQERAVETASHVIALFVGLALMYVLKILIGE